MENRSVVAMGRDRWDGVGEGTNYAGAVLETGDTGQGFIAFTDTSSATAGIIEYGHANNVFSIRANDNIVLRINGSGTIYPETSGGANLGRSDNLWGTVYAQTGTINTSDEREKDNFAVPDEALMRAWGKVNYKIFQYKDALAKKGDMARLHVGFTAQDVDSALASENIDANRYGLFCYDEWGDEYDTVEVVDADAV